MRLMKMTFTGFFILIISNFYACSQGSNSSDILAEKALQYHKDRTAIEKVLVQYTTGLDTLNPDLYANTFTEDAKFYRGEDEDGNPLLYKEGRDAIRSIITDMLKRREEQAAAAPKAEEEAESEDTENDSDTTQQAMPRKMHHIMTNAVIDIIDENNAHHYSYWATIVGSGRSFSVAGMGRYDDKLVKRDGQWLIHERNLLR